MQAQKGFNELQWGRDCKRCKAPGKQAADGGRQDTTGCSLVAPCKQVPQIEQSHMLGSWSCQDVRCTCSVRQSGQYFSLISESTTEENTSLYKVGHILKEQLVQIQ